MGHCMVVRQLYHICTIECRVCMDLLFYSSCLIASELEYSRRKKSYVIHQQEPSIFGYHKRHGIGSGESRFEQVAQPIRDSIDIQKTSSDIFHHKLSHHPNSSSLMYNPALI